ncbi:L-proline amide hydrolase [Salipiger thiooxidans]|uniref:L-proline amide hydrolase n=1 Tax=Salipiger thiooxidans TaxID=282683 RepID=A0A1G7FNY4_9RHOB|nr:proline iminopeptidase-family hydrolase [Salipiger thiooxidans]SDE77617.1 L-proline amide hydrolase [Salipiger thiooxidans]
MASETISVREGFAEFGEWKTWYRVTGDLDAGPLPLVVAHGGPGCTHSYVDSFKDLAALDGRAVIHYDQLGCGASTRLPEKGAEFWTVELFLAELDNLLKTLGIADRYAYLGQSWGGMLGSEHAVRQPEGLKALVIADSPASMKTWVAEANRLRKALPGGIHETLLKHEQAGTMDDPEYLAATDVFYRAHVCRCDPWPAEVQRTFDAMAEDPTVYGAMNGPTEFHVIGTLKDWTVEERLSQIDVPTLVISGRHDEATPLVVKPFVENIPDNRWVVFEESSHMPHYEEREACMAEVSAYLRSRDDA